MPQCAIGGGKKLSCAVQDFLRYPLSHQRNVEYALYQGYLVFLSRRSILAVFTDAGSILILCHPENAFNSCMGVLDIEYRVFICRLLCKVKVKLEMGIAFTHKKKEPRCIPAYLVEHLLEGSKLPCPCRHSHRLSILIRVTNCIKRTFSESLPLPEWPWRMLHTGNVSMMIRTPYIDESIEPSVKFVLVIGYVRGEICFFTVRLDEHPVFILFKHTCLKPECSQSFS